MVRVTDIPYAFSLEMSMQTLKAKFPYNLTSVAKSVELVFLGQPNNRKHVRVNNTKNSKVN